ncbi:MAG: 5-formyltetrahydrofolate cyclo-ligase [Candidatus Hydrogenedentota bacterium]|nr:MAG: 5-formyltetrahydrofolate cyclo-ligase [Candidatus Hydrogenedentota bacterium]
MSRSREVVEAKRSLRKEKIRWRSSLPAEEARLKSERIAAAVKALPEYADAKTILFYVSAKPNEADTHSLIREALSRGVRVLVPATDFDRKELIVSEVKGMEELIRVRFGLLEPHPDLLRPTDAGEADVVIVPGVAFDRHCRRIGFGGGYYDRLLAEIRVPSVALSYEGQLVERIPVDSNDVPVDVIVTECRVYRADKRKL